MSVSPRIACSLVFLTEQLSGIYSSHFQRSFLASISHFRIRLLHQRSFHYQLNNQDETTTKRHHNESLKRWDHSSVKWTMKVFRWSSARSFVLTSCELWDVIFRVWICMSTMQLRMSSIPAWGMKLVFTICCWTYIIINHLIWLVQGLHFIVVSERRKMGKNISKALPAAIVRFFLLLQAFYSFVNVNHNFFLLTFAFYFWSSTNFFSDMKYLDRILKHIHSIQRYHVFFVIHSLVKSTEIFFVLV